MLSLLLLSLLLVFLDLGPLLILSLPLAPHLLPLLLWPGTIALNAPIPLFFPMSVAVPASPVGLKALVRDPLIVPAVSVPVVISVVASPARIHVVIEARDAVIVSPTAVVVMGARPAAVPLTPPPAVPEEHVRFYIGHDVDAVRVGHDYHFGRCLKYDGRRQRKSDADINSCHRRNRVRNG
jgi:hypothetical protein